MARAVFGSFAFNAAAAFIRQGVATALRLLILVLVTRVYGPAGAGIYAVASLIPTMLVAFSSLGIGQSNIFYLASGRVAPRMAWRVTLQLAAVISVLGLLVGSCVILFLGDRWFPDVPPKLLWTALLSYPFLLLLGFVASILQGLGRFRQLNAVLIFHPLVNLLVVFLLVISGNRDVGLLLVGYLAGALVAFIFARLVLQPYLVGGEGVDSLGYHKRVLNYGYKAQFSNVLSLVNYKIDILLVSALSGGGAAGIYVVAVQMAEKLWLYSQAVSTVLLPKLSRLHREGTEGAEITPVVVRWVVWGTLFLALILALLGGYLITTVFGVEFKTAYVPLLVLLPGVILGAGARILANDLSARGRPELDLYTAVVVLIINVIGNLYAIPRFGLVGAAMTTTLAYSANFAMLAMIYGYLSGSSAIGLLVPRGHDWTSLKMSLTKKTVVKAVPEI